MCSMVEYNIFVAEMNPGSTALSIPRTYYFIRLLCSSSPILQYNKVLSTQVISPAYMSLNNRRRKYYLKVIDE